jgi:hypothetical protein
MQKTIYSLPALRELLAAARVVGLSPQTLYRWMKIPEFIAEYREARRASVGHAFQDIGAGTVLTGAFVPGQGSRERSPESEYF